MKTLIRGGTVLRMDPERTLLDEGFVLVDDDTIVAVGPDDQRPLDGEVNHVVDAAGCLVVPGLINAHQHHWYHLLKGISEGYALEDWFERVLAPASAALTRDDLLVSMSLAAADMITTGTTTFFNHSVTETSAADIDALASTSTATGMRQVFGKELRALTSAPNVTHRAEVEDLLVRYAGAPADSLFSMALAVESGEHWLRTGAMSGELAGYAAGLAARFDVRVSDHITGGSLDRSVAAFRRRTGLGQVEWLAAHGLLSERSLLAHAVWIESREVELAARAGASIVTCPSSSAFTAGGIPPIRDWLAAGVNVAVGSDGPMVNDSVDMLGLLREAFLLQSVKYLEPAPVPTATLWELATSRGAAAIGAAGRLGEISVGAVADLAVFDLRTAGYGTALEPAVNAILSGGGHETVLTMVAGRILRDRSGLLTIDLPAVLDDAGSAARALLRRAGLRG